MAYIGREPSYGLFEKQVLVPSGAETLFSLDFSVGASSSLLVVDGGSVKNPEVDYTIVEGGTKIQLSSPPTDAYIVYLGKQLIYPQFGKVFLVRDLNENVTLQSSELADIVSVNPIAANRTLFIPIASAMAGYQFIARNRSETNSVIINAGETVTTIPPNQSITIVSDSVSWFVAP